MPRAVLVVLAAVTAVGVLTAADATDTRSASQKALKRFNPLIGKWRGVGQPRRGSATGAWSEKSEWTWEFDKKKNSVAVRYKSAGTKLLADGIFGYDPGTRRFTLQATFADKTRRRYTGRADATGTLILESTPDKKNQVYRLTIRQLNSKRTLVLHERRRTRSTFYTRVAGIGYTRSGTRLAAANTGPLCIVTEGRGTSKVSYKGKTYWVCCSGCRDAFLEDPEGILAEAKKREVQRKRKKAKTNGSS
jgi:YHS domain-containing protein